MAADLNNVDYYKNMLEWAMNHGKVELVEHSDGSYGLKHKGELEASQLEAAYFGLLAKAGLLTAESTLILPASEVAVDKEVIQAINKPTVYPKPSVPATPAVQEPSAAANTSGAPLRKLLVPKSSGTAPRQLHIPERG